jgi:hypothetical protein
LEFDMGFLIVGTGGGGSSAPDGTLPTYTTMSALDAGLTVVGRMAQLVGATTGAVILTCRRVAAGAGGLEILGPILLWQADGTEFDGSFAWAALAGASITWGVAGAEATGGLILDVGYAALPGFRPLRTRNLGLSARMVAVALPVSPATGDGACVGAHAVAAARARLGGFGYSTTSPRSASASSADTASATPTLSVSSTTMTVADGVALDLSMDCPNYGGVNTAAQGAANRVDGTGSSAIARPTAGAVTGGDAADYRPVFFVRNMTARFTRLHCGEFAL